MKKLLIGLTLLLAGTIAGAQPYTGTRAATSGGITLLQANDGTWIHLIGNGVPVLTTFLGDAVPANTLYTNTATGANYFFSSGSWTLSSAGTASAITAGTTTAGTCASKFIVGDSSNIVQCPSSVAAFTGGAGGGVLTFRDTMSGGSSTNNFLKVTGTTPTTLTALTYASLFSFTGAGSSAQNLYAFGVGLAAGYTGSGASRGIDVQNLSAATGTWSLSFPTGAGNAGVYALDSAVTTGTNFGVVGRAVGGDISVGIFGTAPTAKNSGTNIGVIGIANNSGTTPIRVGGFFGLNAAIPTFTEAALVADNSSIAVPIFIARDNDTTVAQIRDGGTIAGKDAISGTDSDTAGGALTIGGGAGTGTGKGGSLVLQTTPSTTTGTTQLTPMDRTVYAAKAVALTDAATVLFTVNTLGAHVRSGGALDFTIEASNGTNDQVANCRTYWAAVDTTAGAGGETCTNLLDGLVCSAAVSGAASSGTLTIAADATTGADLCNYRITPSGSLTETVYNVYYTITKNLPGGVVSLP